MEAFEFEGKTVEEAVEKACCQLNLPKEKLDIKIIAQGSTGIFGLVGGRKAKIKITIHEEVEPPQNEIEENGVAIAKETLDNILSLIPMEETVVNATQDNGRIILNIEGDKSGLLIGRKGKTLDALQFIVNKIVNKTLEKRCHVVVDSENYRQRSYDYLTQMALKLGEKAKKIKRPVVTSVMNSHDRRIIHLTLKGDEELSTRSRGGGFLKEVIIIPKQQVVKDRQRG